MSRKTIKQLSPAVVNKIAAGEVIERPASVVKELVENAIDAGAAQVAVSIHQGGGELIRVVDDGHGIPAEELPLAICSHATSKIRDADDLFRVDSMGFRGEALASIAEVSEFLLRSRVAEEDAGAEIEVVGGQGGQLAPCGCSKGTTIEVRRLFFNTPVRRKFMRTPQTEMSHATEAITRIALAHPKVRFVLDNGKRETLALPPVEDIRDRIASCFGSELAEDLIYVESEDEFARIHGFVANPKQSRSSNKHQYLFLNGRHIRDRALQHALAEAYRGILLTGRHPIAFLNLQLAPEAVDVNVHPTKLEVRFQDSGRLYKQLLGMLRTRFLTTDLTATFRPSVVREEAVEGSSAGDVPSATRRFDAPFSASGRTVPPPHAPFRPFSDGHDTRPREIVDWARGEHGEEHRDADAFRLRADSTETQHPLPWQSADQNPPATSPPPVRRETGEVPAAVAGGTAMQVHNRYLVTANDEGIIVIDQHALHERVIYEQLRAQVLQQEVEKQRLLVPEPVQLTPVEAATVLQSQALLSELGIEVSDFGGNSVLVSSYPSMLANFNPADLIRQLADQLAAGTKAPDPRDLLDEILHMISCKAAIKAGDRLSAEEIESLIQQRHLVQDSHHCPHGRPTTLVFTQKELDKRFQRT